MRIIYLDGEAATGKTTRKREIKEENPGRVITMNHMGSFDDICAAAIWQGVAGIDPSEAIVVIDPDGKAMPDFTFEIERFEQ